MLIVLFAVVLLTHSNTNSTSSQKFTVDGWELDADRLEECNNYAARVYLCIFVAVLLSVCVSRNLCERNAVLKRERGREIACVLVCK